MRPTLHEFKAKKAAPKAAPPRWAAFPEFDPYTRLTTSIERKVTPERNIDRRN